ncbi:hypothetical protein T4B_1495 [Trichinella pseudospiralis]|uniref:Uncharacterized protein n=1 Tax=Trichinella pseudospiralis TaxID=6337 RepID=A0A0V1JFL1_TRIPS|nr:hypothetical protein T4B_1495 [Trichinella pseudospiralis]
MYISAKITPQNTYECPAKSAIGKRVGKRIERAVQITQIVACCEQGIGHAVVAKAVHSSDNIIR